jgi:serralysin
VAEQAYHGGESPDPLSPCAGYNPGTGPINTGVPIFALLPNAPTAATLTATLTPDGGSPATSCAYDETSYTNPDPTDQSTGQQVMASRHQVIVVPHDPLTQGVHYTVSISVTYSGDLTPTVTTWGFTAAALPRVSIGNASVVEGNQGPRQMRYTVSLSSPSTDPVTVAYATVAGTATAGSDFVAKSGTVNFAPGATAAAVAISIKGDRTPEPQEMFSVRLSNAVNALRWRSTGTGTIIGDDNPSLTTPELSIGSASLVEGNSTRRALRFAVTLSSAATVPVSVDWDTQDGTADSTANVDFVDGHGNLTIPAGALTGTVLVKISADVVNEPNELFTVKLTDATGVVIRRSVATGTIIDDD